MRTTRPPSTSRRWVRMFLAALLLAGADPPAPTTVNGQVLGKAAEFTTSGPTRVCIENLMVTALPRESITLGYAGIHNGALRINRGRSWIDVTLGEIWKQPRQVGDVIERRPSFYIADVSEESELRYGLFAYDEYYKGNRLQVFIEGPGLSGDEADRSILRRIELRQDESPPCDVTYHFGWDMLFGEEPLVQKPQR
jgi:hypothetical protein